MLHTPITEDRYYLQVIASEYLSNWELAQPLKQGILEKVANCLCENMVCRFRKPDSKEVDGGAGKKKFVKQGLKCHKIQNVTITQYHDATFCRMEQPQCLKPYWTVTSVLAPGCNRTDAKSVARVVNTPELSKWVLFDGSLPLHLNWVCC